MVDPVAVAGVAFRIKPVDTGRRVPVVLPDGTTIGTPEIGSPEWYARIPPPEPDGTSRDVPFPDRVIVGPNGAVVSPVQDAGPSPEAPRKRVVVSYGPREGKIVVGVEVAPDWDVDTSCTVDADALRQLLPIIRELVKVKNLIGADLYAEQPTPHSNGSPADIGASAAVGGRGDAVGHAASPAKRGRRAG